MADAYEASREALLAEIEPAGPGLYGDPPLLTRAALASGPARARAPIDRDSQSADRRRQPLIVPDEEA